MVDRSLGLSGHKIALDPADGEDEPAAVRRIKRAR
jgi:hypothetical protein